MINRGQFVLVVLLALGAAMGGAMIGRTMVAPPRALEVELHELMHEQLRLDVKQAWQVDALEQRYEARRRALETQQQADTQRVNAAILAEHGYGPQVAAAVEAQHCTMADLQKATLEDVGAMRAVLHPDQTARYDAGIATALSGQH